MVAGAVVAGATVVAGVAVGVDVGVDVGSSVLDPNEPSVMGSSVPIGS